MKFKKIIATIVSISLLGIQGSVYASEYQEDNINNALESVNLLVDETKLDIIEENIEYFDDTIEKTQILQDEAGNEYESEITIETLSASTYSISATTTATKEQPVGSSFFACINATFQFDGSRVRCTSMTAYTRNKPSKIAVKIFTKTYDSSWQKSTATAKLTYAFYNTETHLTNRGSFTLKCSDNGRTR